MIFDISPQTREKQEREEERNAEKQKQEEEKKKKRELPQAPNWDSFHSLMTKFLGDQGFGNLNYKRRMDINLNEANLFRECVEQEKVVLDAAGRKKKSKGRKVTLEEFLVLMNFTSFLSPVSFCKSSSEVKFIKTRRVGGIFL